MASEKLTLGETMTISNARYANNEYRATVSRVADIRQIKAAFITLFGADSIEAITVSGTFKILGQFDYVFADTGTVEVTSINPHSITVRADGEDVRVIETEPFTVHIIHV